jgi:hypothetical protein
MWLRTNTVMPGDTPVAGTSGVLAQAPVTGGAPESYVVPAPAESRSFVPPAQLANYVVAHSEFTTPLNRRNLLSALVAGESGTQGAAGESDERVDEVQLDDADAQ